MSSAIEQAGFDTDMSCFCTTSLGPLSLALPGLSVSAALNLSATAQAAMRLDAFLTARASLMGLNMGWPALVLPRITLSASAMMNVALMAQLRAQLMARLGLDLMIPRQATAFLRMAATLNARMPAMPGLNLAAWLQLGQFNAALLRIQVAIAAGAFASANQIGRAHV